MPCPNKLSHILTNVVTGCHPLALKVTADQSAYADPATKSCVSRTTFGGAKPITRYVDERERSNLAGLRRKVAEKTPYPYFLQRLEDMEASLKAGFLVRRVSQSFAEESVRFPGSYRSFLRCWRNHCQAVAAAEHPKAANLGVGDSTSSKHGRWSHQDVRLLQEVTFKITLRRGAT
jgi:hypothetical protein